MFLKSFRKSFFLGFLQNYVNTLYTCKQPLTIASEMSKRAQDNFGKFIHQFKPEIKTYEESWKGPNKII